ncbi:guanylate-binding protein, partial [Baffinella frigidus]
SEPETGAEFSQFFPHFLWVVRDFSLILEDESGSSFTSKTYLERSLTPMAGFSEGVEVKNRIRRMLLAFFPNRDCVTLKRPVEDETQLQNLDNADWSAFRPEFVAQVHGLRKKIYHVHGLRKKIYQDAPPKCLHGKPLDGFMLGHLAINYAEAINNGTALNIGDAWSQVSKSRNVKAVEEAHEHYERNAAACVDEMPMTAEHLDERHQAMRQEAQPCRVEHLDERHLAMRQEALADFKKTCIGVGGAR